MRPLQRLYLLLAALPAIFSCVPVANAQTTTTLACTAFVTNQPIMRQEGTTEPAGDIIIQCQGQPIGAQTGSQTLSLYTSVPITSRALVNSTAGLQSIPTEAALIVSYNGIENAATPIQGFLQNGALVFSGFSLPSGQTACAYPVYTNCVTNNSFSVRITNVRVNANSLTSGSFVTGTVLATFPISNQSGLVLGAVQASLSVNVSSPISTVSQCQSQGSSTTINNLRISELVNNAFKLQGSTAVNGVGQWYQYGINTESITVLSANPPGWTSQLSGIQPGKADAGTRIRINFANIPAGVTVSLPITIASGTTGQIVATTGGDLGAFSIAAGTSISLQYAGSITYEVRAQNAGSIDSFAIPVTVTSSSNSGAGTITTSATYTATTSETSTQIPAFVDTSYPTNLFTVLSCSPPTISCSPSTGPVTAGNYYQTHCTASGGNPNYAFTTSLLPAGLSFYDYGDGNAYVYGYPTATGSYSYTVTVTDSTNKTASQSFSGVLGYPTLTSISPTGVAAGSGAFTLTVNGTFFDSNAYIYFNGYYLYPSSQTATLLSKTGRVRVSSR